jgi:hypothetical protein
MCASHSIQKARHCRMSRMYRVMGIINSCIAADVSQERAEEAEYVKHLFDLQ